MKIALTAVAEDDLAAIYAYYAGRSGAAAVAAILKAVDGLASLPPMGRLGDVPETRERTVMRYPYRIIYHLDEAHGAVEVWRIVHGWRQWPPMDTA